MQVSPFEKGGDESLGSSQVSTDNRAVSSGRGAPPLMFSSSPPWASSSRPSSVHINLMAEKIKRSICNSLAASLKDRRRSAGSAANMSTRRLCVCARARPARALIIINDLVWMQGQNGDNAKKVHYLVVQHTNPSTNAHFSVCYTQTTLRRVTAAAVRKK